LKDLKLKAKGSLIHPSLLFFSKSPSCQPKANNILKNRFGELRDPDFPELKKLCASVFGIRESVIYDKYKIRMKVNRETQKLILEVQEDANGQIFNDVYLTFDDLRRACVKLCDLFFVNT
jgi:hypothetical protein